MTAPDQFDVVVEVEDVYLPDITVDVDAGTVIDPGEAVDAERVLDVLPLPGQKGEPGADSTVPGPPGPQGPPGDVSLVNAALGYRHVQMTPEAVWVIDHPLRFSPNVSVYDSTGAQVEGEVLMPADGSYSPIVLRFSAAFGGTAHLS